MCVHSIALNFRLAARVPFRSMSPARSVPAFRGHVAPGARLLPASEVRHHHPHRARHPPRGGGDNVYRAHPHEVRQKTEAEGFLSFARVFVSFFLSPRMYCFVFLSTLRLLYSVL